MSRRARYNRHSRQGNLNRRSNGDPENQNNGSGRPQNTSSSQDVSVRVACGNSDDFAQTSQSQQMSMLPQIPVDSIVSHGPVTQVTNSHSSQRSVSHSNSDSTINTGPGNTSNISRSDQLDEEHQHECTILSLPDDVLFLICTYIQPKELCHMSCVCRRFQYLISKDTVWIQHAKVTAVVKNFPNCRPCSAKELCRVAPKWRLGRFKEGFAVKYRHRLMPWVHKNDDGLWFSMGNSIHFFRPSSSGHLLEDKNKCLHGLKGDATRFVVKKDKVVSGCRDGSVSCWEVSGTPLFSYQQVHSSDTQCVDFTDSVIISGSRDRTCKVLSMEALSKNDGLLLQTFDVGERVWSLKISPCESFFAAGLAGCLDDPPVIMWDIESGECLGQLSMNHRRGAGVLDLRFESPHELLTCGYDTFIRMWDLRTQTCVRQWEEPHDSALYCIESDGNNAILVGTARHGMVRLWDKRQTEPVQVYYSNSRNSPVYSLAVDYGHLYLALDVGLNVMDFTYRNTDITAGCSTRLQDMTGRENTSHRRSFKR